MGASRQTQRAQEHAQRRITRDDPHPSVPELREAWREMAKDATPDARHALSQLVDSHDRWVVRAERAERERDRLRAALDEIAHEVRLHANGPANSYGHETLRSDIAHILAKHGFGGAR